MTRVTVHTVENAPEPSHDELKLLEARIGKVLNIHGAMAHAPVVLQAYAALQRVIGDYGTFDAVTLEAIALVVANVDSCACCESAHTLGAQAAGLSAAQTAAVRDGSYADDPRLGRAADAGKRVRRQHRHGA